MIHGLDFSVSDKWAGVQSVLLVARVNVAVRKCYPCIATGFWMRHLGQETVILICFFHLTRLLFLRNPCTSYLSPYLFAEALFLSRGLCLRYAESSSNIWRCITFNVTRGYIWCIYRTIITLSNLFWSSDVFILSEIISHNCFLGVCVQKTLHIYIISWCKTNHTACLGVWVYIMYTWLLLV